MPAAAKPRVLIVDDDDEIRTLLARLLRQECSVDTAEDGPSAVALASRTPAPDLVLMDVMMPGMDGFAVAQRLRLLKETKRVPILFLTARDTPMDVIRGIQAGARAYITKPFKIEEVLSKVRAILMHEG